MDYDIAFAPVGADSSKAGDAIHIRYQDQNGLRHMVVDGGTKESGQFLVDDIKATGGDLAVVEHMVLTHADGDHASGLRIVLDQLPVRNLYINPPWSFAGEAMPFFANKRWTEPNLRAFLRDRYDLAWEVFRRAQEQGTHIWYALQGQEVGPFTILSPSRNAMVHLLPQFDHEKDPDEEALRAANWWIDSPSVLGRLVDALFEKAEKAIAKMSDEAWDLELLRNGGITSACNESSVVMYGRFGTHNALLTGDAGPQALRWAANYAEAIGLPLQSFSTVQIPHHGSRRNVGPAILDRLLGPRQPQGSAPKFIALCSAPKDDEKHPRRMVLNAFARRGGEVLVTRGSWKSSRRGLALRPGWSRATPEPFHARVEDYT